MPVLQMLFNLINKHYCYTSNSILIHQTKCSRLMQHPLHSIGSASIHKKSNASLFSTEQQSWTNITKINSTISDKGNGMLTKYE